MAAVHFTHARSAARSSSSRPASQSPPTPGRGSARQSATDRGKPVAGSRELIAELTGVAQHLEGIYSTCVTLQWALRGQNAEQDADLARCLMRHVSEPVSAQVERLQGILRRLQSRSKSMPERP